MYASELVRYLQELIAEHGDHRIVTDEDGDLSSPEFYEDSTETVFVVDILRRYFGDE